MPTCGSLRLFGKLGPVKIFFAELVPQPFFHVLYNRIDEISEKDVISRHVPRCPLPRAPLRAPMLWLD